MAEPSTPTLPQTGEETARELLAVRDFLFACADEANRQRLKFMSTGNKLTARDLNSEANAYRNAAAMIEREDHASYRATILSALGPPPTEVREGPTNAMIAAGERVLIDRSVRDPEGKWWGYAKKVWLAMEAERLGS